MPSATDDAARTRLIRESIVDSPVGTAEFVDADDLAFALADLLGVHMRWIHGPQQTPSPPVRFRSNSEGVGNATGFSIGAEQEGFGSK